MKFAIASEHRDYFQKHKFLELENVLSPQQVEGVNNAINNVLSIRLGLPAHQAKKQAPEKLFMEGRDLWRSHAEIKKIVCSRGIAEIASDVMNQRPLRLAYDQLLVPPVKHTHPILGEVATPYSLLMNSHCSLVEMSSIQGIVCGVMLCLSDCSDELVEAAIPSVLSLKAGNAVYFHPELPLDFSLLKERQSQRFLLVAYMQAAAVYMMQKNDPHVHHLKRFDYQFGDRISIKHHPVIYS